MAFLKPAMMDLVKGILQTKEKPTRFSRLNNFAYTSQGCP